ncbi:MAG: cytochrome-c peroxidase [Muricauda sp.]|nr:MULTISPECIES: cytochrome c peroxidase [unclassified Allomuricauda]MAU15064.1 cytochrome-c peroxidase [Allomuricauda sp.]|tara:strand:+ start:24619 stop:25662 length:1044 start_codon:yes stop_codon:yes gene_type:complete
MKYLLWIPLLLVLGSCHDDSGYIEVEEDERLAVTIPSNFPPMVYDIEENPPTKLGFALGKKLFYDGKLSANGFISCGFCHEQRYSFTHHGHQFSHGIDDLEGTRNTPSIANMAFFSEFAWDGATSHLDLFPIIPITNEVEMGETMTGVLEKLQADSDYQKAFNAAFEDGGVTHENFLKAIAQFMVMMVSYNSKYDKYVRNEDGVTLTEQELEGLSIFNEKCASCHNTDLFSDGSFRNNGLPPNPNINDLGRALVSGSAEDNYKFKVPSLRNVALTAPYMHDGRFGSLESVLNFYQNGVQDSPTLDPLLKTEEGLGISLNDTEKLALIAFLNTLTDEEFINDERFAEY